MAACLYGCKFLHIIAQGISEIATLKNADSQIFQQEELRTNNGNNQPTKKKYPSGTPKQSGN